MKKTIIGIKFTVVDLSSNYEIVGTSDNYSFQYSLGKGANLVDESYEEYIHSVDLKGNYGTFNVRVFAVNDIGIRSKYIEKDISISAPRLNETFLFNNVIINVDTSVASNVIQSTPTKDDRTLIVNSNFIGRKALISWELVAPPGHVKEGQSLSRDLLSDTFFNKFEIKIKNGKDEVVVSDEVLNSSPGLQNYLLTDDVSGALLNYRNFSFEINQAVFEDLGLGRNFTVEIKSFDSYDNSSTAIIRCENPEPEIDDFIENIQSSFSKFLWNVNDNDFEYVDIKILAVERGFELYEKTDIDISSNHIVGMANAQDYIINNYFYNVGEKYLYQDGNIYEVIQEHEADLNKNPTNTDFWLNLGPLPQFEYFNDINIYDNYFEFSQKFGFDYYYSFCTYDNYGKGFEYNLVREGVQLKSDDSILHARSFDLKIGNVRYREREDSIVFNWDFVNHLEEIVDISDINISSSNDPNGLLGVHAVLYDIDTDQNIYRITEGNNSKTIVDSSIGGSIEVGGLISARMFDEYEYTREINNSIYGTEGYPPGTDFFDNDKIYSPENYDYTFSDSSERLYECLLNNSYLGEKIRPAYEGWDSNRTYQANEDRVLYQGNIYKLTQDFGPESSIVEGFYNENNSYSSNTFVCAPSFGGISIFDSTSEYNEGDYVYYNGKLYFCLIQQNEGEVFTPSSESVFYWKLESLTSSSFAIYKAKSDILAGSLFPYEDTDNWEYQNPENCTTHFELIIEQYNLNSNEWGTGINFGVGNYSVYKNDIWLSLQNSGPDYGGFIVPDQDDSYWVNVFNGSEDIVSDHLSGDLVIYNDSIYKCLADNPTGAPIDAIKMDERDSLSNYEDCQWKPFWQYDSGYLSIPLMHSAIPEGGKRNVGLKLFLLDINENIISSGSIAAENPAPYILYDDFNNTDGFIDSVSETTKVKFNFKYALDFQEKTTKVHLYRSSEQHFDITGSDGLPYSSQEDPSSTLAKITIGEGDASFGENVTFLEDSPIIPTVPDYEKYVNENQFIYEQYILEDPFESKESWGESHWLSQGQNEGYELTYKEVATGYYYKILPFDDFGSGVLHTVRYDGSELINVFPKTYHNKNKYASNGPVVGAGLTITEGAIPFAVRNLNGQAAFENYFLNWSTIDNDIDFFEVWANKEGFEGEQSTSLITGLEDGSTGFFEQQNNTGYRKTDGVIYSVGDVAPREVVDEAWRIRNAKVIFEVPSNAKSIETVYPGSANETKNFWVRAVDFAGNKSPFTGAALTEGDNISGLSLSLESISATDVSDFETSLTSRFINTIALEPNNPFQANNPEVGKITWDSHDLYFSGDKYQIDASDIEGMGDGYIWWQLEDNQYTTGLIHPANSDNSNFKDGDFIVGRSRNGFVTPTFNVFANALIGTANIAEAAVDSARIKDLTADKILAGEISGQDITLWSTYGEEGAIRTRGFDGVDHAFDRSGFLLSGDGSFAFQAGDSSLSLQNDTLTLVGKIRQSDTKDYDFIDINVVPGYFNYIEGDDGFVLQDDSSVDIEVSFRNTRTDLDEDKVYFKMESIVGGEPYTVFDYRELGFNQIISGFQYHTFTRKEDGSIVVNARLNGGFLDTEDGFHDIITNPVPGTTGDAVVLYVSGEYSSYEKSSTITRVIDGKIGIDGEPAKTVKLEATDYSIIYDDKGLSPKFKSGPNTTQIQISAEASDFYSFPQYRFTKDGVVYAWSTNTFNYGPPDTWTQGASVIKVEVREGSSGNASASDSISIIRVKQGENALAGVLTNENHTIPANNDGSFSSSNLISAGGNFEVFYGGEKITTGITFGISGSSVKSDLKITIDGSGVYTLSNNTASTWSTDLETFDLTATYDGETITKRYSISKSKEGIQGVHAKSVRINAESLVFKKDKDGSVSPDRIKLTAVTQNTSSINASWSGSSEIYTSETGTTKVTTPTNQVWVDKAALGSGKVTITATHVDGVSDSTTLILVEDGSNNVQAVLSNESHTLTELSDGTFDLSGSGTDIQVFDGSNLLQYTSGNLTDGKFKVENISKTGGVNFGTSSTAEGSTTYTMPDLSSATGAGTLTFTIKAQKGNGETVTLTKVQSFAVSKFGANGVMGVSPTYRGKYDSSKRYYFLESTENKPGRGDIVEHTDGLYYICTETHGDGISPNPGAATPGDPSDFWRSFDAQFQNVATDLLLTEEAFITTTLTVGETNPADGPPSYFKFDADAGRLDMRGAVVNNTIAEDVGFNLSSLNIPGNIQIAETEKTIYGSVGTTDFNQYLVGHYQVRIVEGSNQQVFTIETITNATVLQVKEASLHQFSQATAYVETTVSTFLGGGYNNEIIPFPLADGGYQSLASSVVGGAYNAITGRFSFIGNGFENSCGDNFSAIVGGYQNKMPKVDSANQGANFIGAGQNNIIDGGTNQSILGGSDNQIIN
jgi:hypothetical protein